MEEIRAAIDALVMSAIDYQHAWYASDEVAIAQATEARPELRPLVEVCFARQEGAECLSDEEVALVLCGGGHWRVLGAAGVADVVESGRPGRCGTSAITIKE